MYKKHILENGLRVLTVPREDTASVTVLVLVGAGSRYENRKNNGVAHFVEHMMFKGTKKRPNTLAISRELDKYGADYNAYTGKDHTGYYIRINSEHLDLALDLLSDMLISSKIDSLELDRERGVIIEEIKMYKDNPLMLAPDLFEQVLYGDKHQLGWSIAGTEKIISYIARKELTDFIAKQYRPSNMLVSLAGNFNGFSEEKVVALAEKYFRYKRGIPKSPSYKSYTGNGTKKHVLITSKESEQVQVMLGTHAYSYAQRDRFPLTLLGVILGGNMSSRLFIRVRERLGLAYFVRADVSQYQDAGSFSIQAGVDPSKLDKAIKAIMKELMRTTTAKVSERELRDAKEFIKGKTTLALENSSALAEWFGRQEILTGKIASPEARLKQLERVTREDLLRVAKKLFQNGKFYMSIIGPYERKDEARFRDMLVV